MSIQDERSQHKNKAKALKLLRAKLFETERAQLAASRAAERKMLVGTADRSERIRTYNFGAGRVRDHRCGLAVEAGGVMSGERLGEFLDALSEQEQAERLAALEGGMPPQQRARAKEDDDY